MAATFTSISPHPSSSSLYHKFHPSTLAYSLNSSIESSTSCLATKNVNLSNGRRNSSTYRPLRVQNAATKQAKSPAEEDWKIKRQVLLEKKVRSVDVKEALRLQAENNFVILDVRPEAEFKEGHPAGAINVQIYRLIKEWTAWDIARRAAFAFFGIFQGTEENPEFIQSVESKLAKDAKIIVACSAGGTTRPTQNLPEGQQSRSLIAAYLLVLNGYKNVFHLDGGIYKWFKEDLPSESQE
ncbi:Rhodanese/Cell cycle control phosphatase superfamily protein [Perilla frutescens var. hirtella]|uniref:Rhodanese/Cell cycle control phosphatase superfamily protein n=1 Tax=Perilla frutescens var. hirtella TaxID=608512 RepID=A0AAD4PF85_PERFH|nr:Rhodanese/Cell cycle control phosphatase superfamily protein [Perilla frutescens var. frutescens]KAH6784100.1 Rhodanese/Cell cycle control phosphatase superfamily protein [Perilla frutescens var. hirtella]KAH6838209.1 Rhodanese/Cell cycle control phosphatase superfamily protein [Perilla frutescens var. hirtella]